MREGLRLRANVTARLIGPDGQVTHEQRQHNICCLGGTHELMRIDGAEKHVHDWNRIAIGRGAILESPGNTALFNEYARVVATVSNPGADHIQFSGDFSGSPPSDHAILESCLDYQDTPSGAILAYVEFAPILIWTPGDTLRIVWEVY